MRLGSFRFSCRPHIRSYQLLHTTSHASHCNFMHIKRSNSISTQERRQNFFRVEAQTTIVFLLGGTELACCVLSMLAIEGGGGVQGRLTKVLGGSSLSSPVPYSGNAPVVTAFFVTSHRDGLVLRHSAADLAGRGIKFRSWRPHFRWR